MTNYVVLFAALRSLSIADVGVFTFAYTLSLLGVTVVRALALEPLTIRFTTASPLERRRALEQASGASLSIGLAVCGLSATVALLVHNDLSRALLAFGVVVPALLVQDSWRIYFFACGRPWAAAVNDTTCLITTALVVIIVSHVSTAAGPATLLASWAVGLTSGVLLGALQARAKPMPRHAWRWLRAHRDLGPALAGERSAESSAAQLSLLLVGLLAGGAALGELGAARALMAPVTTLTTSMTIFGLPEAARLRHRSRALTRFAAGMSVTTAAAVLSFTLFLLAAPAWLGRSLTGDNWENAKILIVPVAVWTAASGARAGPALGLRTYQRADTLLRLSLLIGAVVLLATIGATWVWGGRGAAWGFAGVYVLAIGLYWSAFFRARRSDTFQHRRASHQRRC